MMDFSPQNTVSQFMTKLSEVVELEGKWEVGLLQTSFPGKVVNVFGGKFSYTVHKIAQQRIDCILQTSYRSDAPPNMATRQFNFFSRQTWVPKLYQGLTGSKISAW